MVYWYTINMNHFTIHFSICQIKFILALPRVNSTMKCLGKRGKGKRVPWVSVTMGLTELNSNEVAMGRKKLSIPSVCKHTHFTWGERLTLQYHSTGTNKYQKITSPTLLGRLLGKHERGDLPFERWEYNAEYAQNDAERKNEGKGSGCSDCPASQQASLQPLCHHPTLPDQ